MNCPVCNVELKISDRQGVEIDYCPKCRGVWLDRGELDKIIERAVPTSSQPEPRYEERGSQRGSGSYDRDSDRDRDYEYDKKKKKSSFLGELFDF